jgi:hypothetical protein
MMDGLGRSDQLDLWQPPVQTTLFDSLPTMVVGAGTSMLEVRMGEYAA